MNDQPKTPTSASKWPGVVSIGATAGAIAVVGFVLGAVVLRNSDDATAAAALAGSDVQRANESAAEADTVDLGVLELAQATTADGEVSEAGHFIGEIVIGDPAAPVEIIEYASMTCPHCASFHEQIYPDLKAKYVDTGKVRFVFREFPLDLAAVRGAVAARCAGEAAVPTYLDLLFKRQAEWTGALPRPQALEGQLQAELGRAPTRDEMNAAYVKSVDAALFDVAKTAGMRKSVYDACMADTAIETAVLETRVAGQRQFEVSSTPSLVIGGQVYRGGRSMDELDGLLQPLIGD